MLEHRWSCLASPRFFPDTLVLPLLLSSGPIAMVLVVTPKFFGSTSNCKMQARKYCLVANLVELPVKMMDRLFKTGRELRNFRIHSCPLPGDYFSLLLLELSGI